MNTWILLLSVLPYICISIFAMSLVWRYDHQSTDDKKRPLKKLTLLGFPLFILFILIVPFLYLSLLESTVVLQLIKNIFTLKGNYQVIINASLSTKAYILFLCIAIIVISSRASFSLWITFSNYISYQRNNLIKCCKLAVRVGVIFVISFLQK